MNLDTILFVGFLLLNLVVGLMYSGKVGNFREYAVGNKDFSTSTLAATIIATCIGGGFFSGAITESYKQGLYFIIPATGEPLALIVTGCILAPRMSRFLKSMSVAESMGNLYGPKVRLITAISSVFLCCGIVALQFKVASSILQSILGISSLYASVASAIIVILYSSIGGIKAVTFTDILQFFTFGTVIPIISLVIWGSIGNPEQVLSMIDQNPMFSISEVFDYSNPKFLSTIALTAFFLIPEMQPVFFQRVVMASNTGQAKHAFIIAGAVVLVLLLITSWVGVLLLSKNPGLNPNNLLPYILEQYSYPGLRGLTAIGVIAIIMSTADSYINAAAVIISHDIINNAGIKSDSKNLMIARISAVAIGVAAFFLSTNTGSILKLLILTLSFYGPIVSPGLLLAIFNFKTTTISVLAGMAAGVSTVVFIDITQLTVIDGVIPGFIANFTFLFGTHYLLRQEGGWIKDQTMRHNDYVVLTLCTKFLNSIRNFNFITFCHSNAPKQAYVYSAFGFFSMASVFSVMYSISPEVQEARSDLFSMIYDTMLIISCIFLTYPIWPQSFQKDTFIAIFWNVAAPYSLIFAPSMLVIANGFEQFQLMILMINMIVLSMLYRWYIAIPVIAISFLSSVECYKYFIDTLHIGDTNISSQFKVMYLLILFSSILIGFLKPKQDEYERSAFKINYLEDTIGFQKKEISQLMNIRHEFLRNIEHESRTPITGVASMAQVLDEAYDKISEAQKRDAIREIARSSERLNTWASNLVDLSRLTSLGAGISQENVDLSTLVRERLEACRRLYLTPEIVDKYKCSLSLPKSLVINCDRYYIGRVIDNLLANALQYSSKKGGNIEITLTQQGNSSAENSKQRSEHSTIELSIKDEGIGIPQDDLENVFDLFTVSSRTKSLAGGRGVGLALAKKIIELHGGTIRAESDGKKGARFVVAF